MGLQQTELQGGSLPLGLDPISQLTQSSRCLQLQLGLVQLGLLHLRDMDIGATLGALEMNPPILCEQWSYMVMP